MAAGVKTVSGKVIDSVSGAGIAGMQVEGWDVEHLIDMALASATTAKDGSFRLEFNVDELEKQLGGRKPLLYFAALSGEEVWQDTKGLHQWHFDLDDLVIDIEVDSPPTTKTERHIYLKIERIDDYNPVEPVDSVPAGVTYKRDCMRFHGHVGGVIPDAEVDARAVPALVYREYLDSDYLIPKAQKLVPADVNEPVYHHRVPGTVIWAYPNEILKIHVLNCDVMPHSLHVHGLEYGIDSDGAWPFGLESSDGKRSDEICPGESWTYTFCTTEDNIGVWPFHDHAQMPGPAIDRGLFGGIIVLPKDKAKPPAWRYAPIRDLARQLDDLPVPIARMRDFERRNYIKQLEWIGERLAPELIIPVHPCLRVINVPLFFHVMKHPTPAPIFDTGDIHENGGTASLVFNDVGAFDYFCTHHPSMVGTIRVEPGGPANATVLIKDGPPRFESDDQPVAPGGTVQWINETGVHHTATAKQGAAMNTHCFNGRGFIGNTPTIVGRPGQKIRWFVFNLDVGHEWHNFHPHAQRWRFGGESLDVRSIGPAESFMVETEVPSVLLLTDEMERIQSPDQRPADARLYRLKGDYLFHCHVHHHFMNGMGGLVRAKQNVWLTPSMVTELENTVGLAIDDLTNDCPDVDPLRCPKKGSGRLEEVPGDPEVIMMHAALLPNTDSVLFWGKTRIDQSRIFESDTGNYVTPGNQPALLPGETASTSDLWSAAHAFLDTPEGHLIAHGGFTDNAVGHPVKCFRFDPADPATAPWSAVADSVHGRFYASTIALGDGKLLTIYGNGGPPMVSDSIEVYDPAADSWSAPRALPTTFDFLFYPWIQLLPDGELFIAGPQTPARKFDWTANPIVDDPAKQFGTGKASRSSLYGSQNGSSLMLTLRPPSYDPIVYILGGAPATVQASVQHIDLSVPSPAWADGPDMHHGRVGCTSILLPDGRIAVAGGVTTAAGGGPIEILDPQDLAAGWKTGPELTYRRLYHSSMILLPDGSIFIGGDDDGADPCERYYPEYYDVARPTIGGAPPTVNYGNAFSIQTPDAPAIAEVVLMRPGAVTHGFDMSQRAVELVIAGGDAASVDVEAPPNGNVAPPGWYLLFVLNASRIPSVGRWIRVTP